MTLEVLQRGKVVSELKLPEADFTWTIGKQNDCDVVLFAPDVSRRHAKLMRVAGVLTICDAGSRHGLAFNGTKTADPMVFALARQAKLGETCSMKGGCSVKKSTYR